MQKEDYRMHPGQKLIFDLGNDIVYYLDKLRQTEEKLKNKEGYPVTGYYHTETKPGLYLGKDSVEPVIEVGYEQYYQHRDGELIPIKEKDRITGAVYDSDKRLIVEEKELPYLRNKPFTHPQFSLMIESYVAHQLSCVQTIPIHLAYWTNRDWNDYVMGYITQRYISQQYQDNPNYVLPIEVEEDMYMLVDWLDKSIQHVVHQLGKQNPYMVFLTKLKGNTLTIKAFEDYRIQQWSQQQLAAEAQSDE